MIIINWDNLPENIKNDLEEENTIEEITVENKVYTI